MRRSRSRPGAATPARPHDAPGDPSARSARWHLCIVALGFFGLRIVLWADGLRFQDRLIGQLQLIDEPLLRDDPFRAFTSLHIQPPLWNFLVGAVRAWSPLPDAFSFQVLWAAASLATMLMLWCILDGLGARQWQATLATLLVAAGPMVIRNESMLRYETPVTLLVTGSAFTFMRFLARPSPQRLGVFGGMLLAGVLTRSLLQPLWMLGGLLLALLFVRRRGALTTRYLVVALVPILFVVGDLAFLHARFGTVGYSSYVGENLGRIAVTTLPDGDLRRLQAAGTLSDFAAVKPYSPFAVYAGSLARCRPAHRDPALVELTKSTGEPNLNSVCYLPVYRTAMRDSIAAIRARPGNYLGALGQAAVAFVSRSGIDRSPDTTSFRILDDVYAPLLLPAHFRYRVGGDDPQPVTAFLRAGMSRLPYYGTVILAVALALWRGATAAARIVRRKVDTTDTDGLRLWIGFTILSVMVVGIGFDFYENGRFREALDPLLLGPLFVVVAELLRRCGTAARAHATRRSAARSTGST